MALIACPECNQQISNKAQTCPKCGFPIQSFILEFYSIPTEINTRSMYREDKVFISGVIFGFVDKNKNKTYIGFISILLILYSIHFINSQNQRRIEFEQTQKEKQEEQRKYENLLRTIEKSKSNQEIFTSALTSENTKLLPQKYSIKAAQSAYVLGLRSQQIANLSQAKDYFQKGIGWDPANKKIQSKIVEIKKQLLDLKYKKANTLAFQGSIDQALSQFKEIQSENKNYKDIQTRIDQIQSQILYRNEQARLAREKESFVMKAIATQQYKDLILRFFDINMGSDLDMLQLFRDQQSQNAKYDATISISGYKWVSEALYDNPRKIKVEYQSYPTEITMRWFWIIDLDTRTISLADSNQGNLVMKSTKY